MFFDCCALKKAGMYSKCFPFLGAYLLEMRLRYGLSLTKPDLEKDILLDLSRYP